MEILNSSVHGRFIACVNKCMYAQLEPSPVIKSNAPIRDLVRAGTHTFSPLEKYVQKRTFLALSDTRSPYNTSPYPPLPLTLLCEALLFIPHCTSAPLNLSGVFSSTPVGRTATFPPGAAMRLVISSLA